MPHYLDNASTTPIDPRVLEVMMPYLTGVYGNASSIHRFGQEARKGIEKARQEVGRLVGAEPREVIFTSGGTEADNLALFGLARAHGSQGHVIVSSVEHHAVLHAADGLQSMGYRVSRAPVDPEGRVPVDSVKDLLQDDTFLISVMWANNETGTLQPIRELAELAKSRGILFHSDAVQAAGHLEISMREIPVDALSLSSHKLSGPKGAGALVLRTGVKIEPTAVGGSHERGRRAGTENVAALVGFGEAARLWQAEGDERQKRLALLADQLWDGLSKIPGARRNGPLEGGIGHIVNVRYDEVDGEALLLNLDLAGVAASSGSACTSGSLEPSHVLLAMGRDRDEARGAIRFSLGITNDEADVEAAIQATKDAVTRMRSLMHPVAGRGM